MKKLSITIASAALVTAALPLGSGCSKSPPAEQALAPTSQTTLRQPASAPLRRVAIPPTLQAVAFHEDLFAPPPAPRLLGDVSATVQLAEQEAARQDEQQASRPLAARSYPRTDGNQWPAITQVVPRTTEPPAELPALRFPRHDPAQPAGAGFDYRSNEADAASQYTLAPQAAAPRDESAQLELSPADDLFPLAGPANAPRQQTAPPLALDAPWQPQDSAPHAPEDSLSQLPATERKTEPAEPIATPRPVPAPAYGPRPAATTPSRLPSQQSEPSLADTREWSAPERSPPRGMLPYPVTEHAPVPQPTVRGYAQQLDSPALMAAPPARALEPVAVEPLQLPLGGGVDMEVVRHHGRMLIERGTALGQRGALYSAQTDFMHALRLVAEAQDSASGDRRHSDALARAWQALEEAEDFASGGTHSVDLAQTVAAHRTSLLKQADLTRLTPLEATQKYFAHAQEQLALAGGDEPVAAEALHCLGKTHVFMARESNDAARTNGPRALAMQQAALMVDEAHAGAANELGVLLAKYGQWNDARRVLLHAVSIQPTSEKWHNLAVVHEHLGEADLARMATQEAELAARRLVQQGMPADGRVRWVSPEQFAHSGNPNPGLPPAASRPGPPPPVPKPAPVADSTAWKWPWFK